MSTLSSPYQSQFKIPSLDSFFSGTSELDILESEFPSIDQGSISVKKLGEFSEENKAIVDQLKSFKSLEENWDAEGALAIPNSVIARSIYWVKQINLSDINVYIASPGPNEEILLMVKGNNREIELIIYPHKEKYVKFEGDDFIQQGNLEDQKFHRLLDWLLQNE